MAPRAEAGAGVTVHAGRQAIASAAVASVLALVLVVWAAVDATTASGVIAFIGAVGVGLVVVALVAGLPAVVAPGVVVLVGAHVLSVVDSGDTLRIDTAVAGAGYLLVSELAYWSLESRREASIEEGLAGRAAAAMTLVAIAGVATATLALAGASAASPGGGLGVEAIGVLATMTIAGSVVWLARRT